MDAYLNGLRVMLVRSLSARISPDVIAPDAVASSTWLMCASISDHQLFTLDVVGIAADIRRIIVVDLLFRDAHSLNCLLEHAIALNRSFAVS